MADLYNACRSDVTTASFFCPFPLRLRVIFSECSLCVCEVGVYVCVRACVFVCADVCVKLCGYV